MMDLVGPKPAMADQLHIKGQMTEVVALSDVNLDVLLEDMETVSSPNHLNGLPSGSTEYNSSKGFLWCSKRSSSSLQNNDSTKTSSLKINRSSHRSNSGSDIDSTCGMVNIHNDSRFNMCENPSDLWFGLKMSDGTPVVINSRNKNFRRPSNSRNNFRNRKTHRYTRPNTGPIDYSSGFLSISKYIGVNSHINEVILSNTTVRHTTIGTNIGPETNRSRGFFKRGFNQKYGMKAKQDRVQEYISRNKTVLKKF